MKTDHIRRIRGNDYLSVVLTLQTCRTNNERVISTFMFGFHHLTLKVGSRLFLTTSEDSQPGISYRLASHAKAIGPIIRELWEIFMTDKEMPVVAMVFFKMRQIIFPGKIL